MDASGHVTYRRDVGEEHGAQNFTNYEERVPAPPRAQRSNYYSKSDGRDGTIVLYIGKDGNPTTGYPHVHVIHDEPNNEILILASYSEHDHSDTIVLDGDASGGDVDAAIDYLRGTL